MTLTLIGNGKMALALAKGLEKTHNLEIIGRNLENLKQFANSIDSSPGLVSLSNTTDITGKTVILCVKPHALKPVSEKLTGTASVLYSVLAGTTLETLKKSIQATHYVRTMPNVAALCGKSATTLTGDSECRKEALSLFSAIGKTLWLQDEKSLDIATALAGCGPAYLALVAESLTDGAVREGLNRQDAEQLTRTLFSGFSELLASEHPALIKESVMSPGGTTAAGIAELEKKGIRSAFMESVHEAFAKLRSSS